MQYGLRKGLALGLCACMAFSALTGCSKKKEQETDHTAALLTMDGGDSISEGAANMLLRYEQAEFESGFGAFIKSYYGDIWNSDLSGTGQPYGEVFKENVMSDMREMLLAKAHMEEYGVTLDDAKKSAIQAAAQAFIESNGEEVLGKMSATQESVEEMLTLYTIRSMMEESMTADVDTVVSDEEAAQRTVSYIYFTAQEETAEEETESEGMLSEAETEAPGEAAAEEEASEAALAAETEVRTQSADVEEVSEAAVESAAEEMAGEAGTEAESETETETESPEMIAAREVALAKAEAFLAEAAGAEDFSAAAQEAAGEDELAYASSYTFGDSDTYPEAEIIEATKGLEDGALVDHVIVIGANYYVLHVDDAFDEAATEDKKVEIVEQRKNERINELYDEWGEGVEFTTDDAAFAAMLFDFSLMQETEPNTEIVEEEADTEAASE